MTDHTAQARALLDDPAYMEQRWGDITRHVMEEIRAANLAPTVAQVPSLFAFGPISRALEQARAEGEAAGMERAAKIISDEYYEAQREGIEPNKAHDCAMEALDRARAAGGGQS